MKFSKFSTALFVLVYFLCVSSSYAVCSTPAGNEGNLRYDSVSKKMQYCDGIDWVEFGVEAEFSAITAENTTTVADGATDNGCTSCPSGYSLINWYVESFSNETDDQVIYNYSCYNLAGNLCYFIEGRGGVGGGEGTVRCGGLCEKD